MSGKGKKEDVVQALYLTVKDEFKSPESAANIISEITWTCRDCKPKNQGECIRCLTELFSEVI